MTTTFKARAEKVAHVGAAKRMIIGILGYEYEQTLVVHSQDAAFILHKKVHAHKHGHLGQRRPDQREALRQALKQLVKEGVVDQTVSHNGGMALVLTRPLKRASKERTQPKRRASTTRKKAA